jgi:hypothetical protein
MYVCMYERIPAYLRTYIHTCVQPQLAYLDFGLVSEVPVQVQEGLVRAVAYRKSTYMHAYIHTYIHV